MRTWLGALEALFDDASQRLMTAFPIRPGWRCLEVGAGAGGLARWLADQVGPSGHGLPTDLDVRFLEGHDRTNLEVRRHDIVIDEFAEEPFDLIHARAVLEHLPSREDTLARLMAALRPGGFLLVEDVDFDEPAGALLARYVSPASAADAVHRVFVAVARLFGAAGADPGYGRRLPAVLAAAGLVDVAAEIHTSVVCGGAEPWSRGAVAQLSERLVATGLASAADIDLFLSATARPEATYAPPFVVSARGRRPS